METCFECVSENCLDPAHPPVDAMEHRRWRAGAGRTWLSKRSAVQDADDEAAMAPRKSATEGGCHEDEGRKALLKPRRGVDVRQDTRELHHRSASPRTAARGCCRFRHPRALLFKSSADEGRGRPHRTCSGSFLILLFEIVLFVFCFV